MPPVTSYTAALDSAQAEKLRVLLNSMGFEFKEKPYALYSGTKGKLNVTVYEKGPKVLVQGKDTEEFVQFHLEPEILGEARLGYEEVLNPEMYEPHFGIDESGKGDFFGPLVVAGVYVNPEIARVLVGAGVTDSKRITSDAKIHKLGEVIRETPGIKYEVISIGPHRYNELYQQFRNLNRLLAWGHAKVIENLASHSPDCPRALSDQFANPRVLESALHRKGVDIEIQQRTKAESDVAVAAASILARGSFVSWLDRKGEELGETLAKGVSPKVKDAARRLVQAHGPGILTEISKAHFRTTQEVSNG